MKRRISGALLHVTSLPSPYGIGDAGPEAYSWAGWLADAGQALWQILPLAPPAPGGLSPIRASPPSQEIRS